jgi:hypothetical protein
MNRLLLVLALATICVAGAAPTAVRAGGQAALQTRIDRLDALTERVEALSAIKRLQHAYGHYSELGLWHDFADLFADTGIGHYTQGALNREGIRSLFLKEVGGGRVGLADGRIYPHISMQPVITLAADGQSARGRWHIMAMLGGYGTSASWAGGVYENQYVRENGVWKMQEVRYHPQYSGRYENPGWTATREPAPLHYDAARVGKPILDPAASTSTPATLADLSTRLTALAGRAQRLTDEIAITNLQHSYGHYVDRRMWENAAELFANDGTMELGRQGVYVGRSSIRRGLGVAGIGAGDVHDHIHLQTIVSVAPDGRSARARGTYLGMTSSMGRALWSQSIYENAFVKQNGAWKFKSVHVYPRFIVDAAIGWAKDAQPAPGPSRTVPPDRPSTESYEIFPKFHIAPLHFNHPVTGRPPQYPAGTPASSTVVSGLSRTPEATVKTPAALERLLAATERAVEQSRAYHAAENLASAYGYAVEQSAPPNVLTVHHVVQPVIRVSPDARSAKVHARLWQLGGPEKGEGSWVSGIYESTAANDGEAWRLSATYRHDAWTAPSPGGWARATVNAVPLP